MERIATFNRVGQAVTNDTIIHENGLPKEMDFGVSAYELGYMRDGNFVKEDTGSVVVVNDVTGRSYGPVSKSYTPVSNGDALGVLADVQRMGMKLERFGETRGGMQYLIGALDEVDVLGDKFTPHLIFRNSFNGRFPIQVAICPLRIVCQNQLNMAFHNCENTISIRHTVKAFDRLQEAQRIMLSTADYLKELKREAEKLANTKISALQENLLISQLFPVTDNMTDRQKETVTNRLAQYQVARKQSDVKNFEGTLWGVALAYSDYLTHQEPVRHTKTFDEAQFVNVTFDASAFMTMLTMAQKIAA